VCPKHYRNSAAEKEHSNLQAQISKENMQAVCQNYVEVSQKLISAQQDYS
jgi:hypothetical protein